MITILFKQQKTKKLNFESDSTYKIYNHKWAFVRRINDRINNS